MNIVQASDVLQAEGFRSPLLNALQPDANNFATHLLQPGGRVDADAFGVHNHDPALARSSFAAFLVEAKAASADLVVTPEDSLPWDVLRDNIESQTTIPDEGQLWVLGCESIKHDELCSLRAELSDKAAILFEELTPQEGRFLDPLAYIFRTNSEDGDSKLVVLVQFKTRAMADPHDYERNNLQLGKSVYQFGILGTEIRLTSLICSDALAFTDAEASSIYDRGIILHIQLNPHPRHETFLEFRSKLLRFPGDSTEVLCLNWSNATEIWVGETRLPTEAYATSAWYGKLRELDQSDSAVLQNHRLGLYYTKLGVHQAHALFLNFNAAIYRLTLSKVIRIAVAGPEGRRRGPQLEGLSRWDSEENLWQAATESDDGFLEIVSESGRAEAQIRNAFETCALACERLVAISAGKVATSNLDWYAPDKLDSFALDRSEMIRRVTFSQDSLLGAARFRTERLRLCAQLAVILQDSQNLPGPLRTEFTNFVLKWSNDAPHQNYRGTTDNTRGTVIYAGETLSNLEIEGVYKSAKERIRQFFPEEEADMQMLRVILWYRNQEGDLIRLWETPTIDRERSRSQFDISRQS